MRQVGKIYKQWSGVVREMFTDADDFAVSFPADLDTKVEIGFIKIMTVLSLFSGKGFNSWGSNLD